nr:hypothetical protein [Tanacetum cinerariifolium]
MSTAIGNKMIPEFESLLKDGGSVELSNFYVVENNGPYKVACHPFKIKFHREDKLRLPNQSVDVIGHVTTVGDVINGERKGKPNRKRFNNFTSTGSGACG